MTRLFRPLCFFLAVFAVSAPCALAQDTPPPVATPTGDAASDLALWNEMQKQNAPRVKTYPTLISNEYIEFLRAGAKATPALTPSVAIIAWDATIDMVDRGTKSGDKALALCDEALALYSKDPLVGALIMAKARVLIYDNHPLEAQTFVDANWHQVTLSPAIYASRTLWYHCLALQAQHKGAQIHAALVKIMAQNPALLDEEAQGGNAWMYRRLAQELISEGKAEEALSWAKLRWMECPFDAQKIESASIMLGQMWQTQDEDAQSKKDAPTKDPKGKTAPAPNDLIPAALKQFAKAQTVPLDTGAEATVNPLAAVEAPALTQATELLHILLTRLAGGEDDPLYEQKTHGRINVFIMTGDWGSAMQDARREWMNPPTVFAGLKEITRVYKAHDLSLTRANAFLDWVATNQGPNPLDQFFKENPTKQAD